MKDFKLIEGEFTAHDAKDVLIALFTEKINYHNRKIFSDEIRHGIQDSKSLERLRTLKEEKRELVNYFNNIDADDIIEIKSSVSVVCKHKVLEKH